MSSSTGVEWFVLALSLSAASGQKCSASLENVLNLVQDRVLIQSFPKDYEVWVHVTPSDLKANACAYTTLGLLMGDWSTLRRNLWEGRPVAKNVDWILKGLSELKVKEKTEGCAWEVPVSQLINFTLQALGTLRNTHCTPCASAGNGCWLRDPDAAGSGDLHKAPGAPLSAADRPTEEEEEEEDEATATQSPRPRQIPIPSAVPHGDQEEGEGGNRSPGPVSRGAGLSRRGGRLIFRPRTPGWFPSAPGAGRRGSQDRPLGPRGLRGLGRGLGRLQAPGPENRSGRPQSWEWGRVPVPGEGALGGGDPAGPQVSKL